jgi:integrase
MPAAIDKVKLPNGMGCLLRYTASGAWLWQTWNARRKKWVYESTNEINRSKAQQWACQQFALRRDGRPHVVGTVLLFATVAEQYVKARSAGEGCKKLEQRSIRSLSGAIKTFAGFVGAGYAALQIDPVDATLLKDSVEHEANRIAVKTANRHLDAILQVLNYACDHHFLFTVPRVARAYRQADEDEDDDGIEGWPCPTPEEVRQILAHAAPVLTETGQRAFNGSDAGRRVFRGINQNDFTDFYAAVCLTGMRLGEARHLTWNDVDFTNKGILIRPGRKGRTYWRPKTKFSVRRIAIVPELMAILQRLHEKSRSGLWVFESKRGTQVGVNTPTARLRGICERLGFEKHYVLHSLRKYWASTVAQQGLDWKIMIKMFGHSDFELILSTYYAQNDDARLVAEASKIDFGLNLPKSA